MGWVEQIAQLYRLHALRRRHYDDATDQAGFIASDVELRELITSIDMRCQSGWADAQLAAPARKALRTMRVYWTGLVLFLEHPWLDLGRVLRTGPRPARRAMKCLEVGAPAAALVSVTGFKTALRLSLQPQSGLNTDRNPYRQARAAAGEPT